MYNIYSMLRLCSIAFFLWLNYIFAQLDIFLALGHTYAVMGCWAWGKKTNENYPLVIAILDYEKLVHGKWMVWMVNERSRINSKIWECWDAWTNKSYPSYLIRLRALFSGLRSIGLSMLTSRKSYPPEMGWVPWLRTEIQYSLAIDEFGTAIFWNM